MLLTFPIGRVRNGLVMFAQSAAGDPTDMNSDEMQGKLKETAGKVTGDERLKNEGRTDQAKGKAEETMDDAKDAVRGVRDSLTDDDDS
jgi:uncharacterized protein YjbJ (UPF0337 family)